MTRMTQNWTSAALAVPDVSSGASKRPLFHVSCQWCGGSGPAQSVFYHRVIRLQEVAKQAGKSAGNRHAFLNRPGRLGVVCTV